MLISIDDLRKLVETEEDDFKLTFRLDAVERSIRAYTNNNFLLKDTVQEMSITGGLMTTSSDIFKEGNTVQVFHTLMSNGIYTITNVVAPCTYALSENLPDEVGTVGLVRYPKDVIAGAVAMIRYDIETDGREGVASESLSRHSVSYVNLDSGNAIAGYPVHVTSFLKPYRRMKR